MYMMRVMLFFCKDFATTSILQIILEQLGRGVKWMGCSGLN